MLAEASWNVGKTGRQLVGTRGMSWVEERGQGWGEVTSSGERSGAGRGLRERGRERRPRLSTEGCRGEERPSCGQTEAEAEIRN